MQIRVGALTDVGQQRDHNEDTLAVVPEHNLYVVADGMGGHSAGEVASALAVETIVAHVKGVSSGRITPAFDPRLGPEQSLLRESILAGNRAVLERAVGASQGMGTTVVAALVSPEPPAIHVAHVGDSRCYRVRGEDITLLTRDHSLLNEYRAAMPDASEADLAHVPPNVITRAVGMQPQIEVDLLSDTPQPGDVYFLCSDGLSGMIGDPELLGLARGPGGPQLVAERLVQRANEHGGDDNVTVIVLAFD
jgi:PPM family protein phosphatase